MNAALLLLLAVSAPLQAAPTPMETTIRASLQKVADAQSAKYNMSIALAFKSSTLSVAVAAGTTDAGLGAGAGARPAAPEDIYVWGSTTKMFTGPAVLQLVEKGVVSLEDPVAKHVDPILKHLNGTTMEDKWGAPIRGVTIRHLLHMTSGIADYDAGPYKADQFASPHHDFR